MQFAYALSVCLCAWLICTGWLLSAIHQLNAFGYAATLLPGLILALVWAKSQFRPIHLGKFTRRFRQPLPGLFLLLSGLIFLGAALYPPSNYDALTYRLPRMLNWMMAGGWHWIPTYNDRMNYSAVNWEWIGMPWVVLTHSDRALFLINFAGFLLMPGLLFFIFRKLGVTRRVAWTWMWLLPLAFGYALQAGSIGNDLLGVLFLLLSLYFGFRARQTQRWGDVWLALLSAALLTGVKVSNAPLALPCLVAVWPAWAQLRRNLVASVFLAIVALTVSALPIMVLNQVYTGSWTGDPNNTGQLQVKNPAAALLGNGVLLAEENLHPPVLPGARKISAAITSHLPTSWQNLLKRDYPRYYLATFNEVPSEEGAALGLGILVLLLAGTLISLGRWRVKFSLVMAAGWLAALVYVFKMGSEAAPRLMLPYYPLLVVPFLMLPGQAWLLQRRLGRIFALLVALSVLPPLILSPLRPLGPAAAVCEKLAEKHPHSLVLERMAAVYTTYAHRNDLLAPLRAHLPGDVREVAFIAGSNDTDYSLWRPFGQRRIIYPRASDSLLTHLDEYEWLVVKANQWPDICPIPLEEWAQAHHFQTVYSTEITELVSWGPEKWCLLHLEK